MGEFEWGWIARFTDDGHKYEDSGSAPMREDRARDYVQVWQGHEDRDYPADSDGKRNSLHVTYSLRRRPKPAETEWEEVP
ncbi:hypothetical protein SEA_NECROPHOXINUS_18 [Microbacterium phage Necrophoxinus]|nr:hypothetical protein SEA_NECROPHOXINUS_18 [Microbacterium phage Necrophoxinus]